MPNPPNKNNKNNSGKTGKNPNTKDVKNNIYYKSKVKKQKPAEKSGFDFSSRSKARQANSYIRAVTLVIVMLAILSAIIFLGMFLSKMISEYKSEHDGGQDDPDIIRSSGEDANEDSSNMYTPKNGDEEVVDIPQIYNNYNGVYLDISLLADKESLLEFIEAAKQKGANAVMIDIKREDSIIPYDSSVSTAMVVGSAVPNENITIQDIIMLLHENGMYISGKLTCFKDDLASTTFPTYSLGDKSTERKWIDSDGVRWLNAYSEEARDYIKKLAVEAVNLGMDEVILDYFFFPNTYTPENIEYNDNGVTKTAIIHDFVDSVKRAMENVSLKSKLGLHIPIRYYLQSPHEVTGINPTDLMSGSICDFFTTSFAPAEIPTTLNVNGKPVANPEASMYNTVNELCNHFKDYMIFPLRPMLQAYDTANATMDQSKIDSQINALDANDIKVWTLIGKDNNYSFN